MSKALDALVAELDQLPAGRRRAVLAELGPAERAAIAPLLSKTPESIANASDPTAYLQTLSPPMRDRVEAALVPASGVTQVARAALKDVLGTLSAASASGQQVVPPRATPSLLAGLGRAFGWERHSS